MSCKQITGDIFDKKFSNPQTCIVQQCNCVALKPHGLSRDIILNFGAYADVYGLRKGNTSNIAKIEDRPEPGTIKFCHGSPNVAALFGQFLYGNSESQWKKRLVGRIDNHFDKGVDLDTKPNRLIYFQKALSCLKEYLLKYNNNNNNNNLQICSIVFPYKIGCGLAGGTWKEYENEIEKFAKQLLSSKSIPFEVLIVHNPLF